MRRSLLAILALAVLFFAACGDDDDETTSSSTSTTTTSTEGAGATGATGSGDAEPEECADAASPPNITQVTSYGVDCAAVEDAMKQIGPVSAGFKLGDFDCKRESGSALSGTWRCNGEAGYFTFAFGD
jgi:hypothetical protein